MNIRHSVRTTTAAIAGATLLAAPVVVLTAVPAQADGKEFSCSGADVDFDVEKDDGRFEVGVDLDDARSGSRWKVVLRHDGRRIHRKIHRATDGDFDIDKNRPNTRGRDVFTVKVSKVGSDRTCSRTIRRR